jgi:hypothetical protein
MFQLGEILCTILQLNIAYGTQKTNYLNSNGSTEIYVMTIIAFTVIARLILRKKSPPTSINSIVEI